MTRGVYVKHLWVIVGKKNETRLWFYTSIFTPRHWIINIKISIIDIKYNWQVTKLDNLVPVRGFSSFKFLPGSHDSIIIALKTEEYRGQTATYITALTLQGNILMSDTRIAGQKFEGLEFIWTPNIPYVLHSAIHCKFKKKCTYVWGNYTGLTNLFISKLTVFFVSFYKLPQVTQQHLKSNF